VGPHMKAYQITNWGQPLEECEVPIPEPQGSEVLIKITSCGVCHSDIHIWDGFFDLGGGKRISLEDRGLELPFTMGHEPVGVVVALGPDAEGVSLGDKRIVYPWIGCGTCSVCRNDEELLCTNPITIGTRRNGGYAEYLVAPHAKYLVSYDGVDEAFAATAACSGITAYSALKKLDHLNTNQTCLIIGAGGVGLAAIGMAKAVLKSKIIVADIDPEKRKAAIAAGADKVFDNSATDAVKQLMALTNGGPSGVVDFVGAPTTTAFGFQVLAKGGTLVVVGLYGGGMELPLSLLPLKVINIRGSYVGTQQDLVELLQLMREEKVNPVPIIKRQLSDAPLAIQDLREGKNIGRYVLINY
jgi:D-arabinose 1-dehydrogenase-like Zn-dependent alcohol dehydrogenase